jgi:hypothetical protein
MTIQEGNVMKRAFNGLAMAVAALLWQSAVAEAQLESVTVTLLPASVSFILTSGSATNAGTVSVAATTSWILLPARSAVSLYGYFSNASAALAHTTPANTMDIPSSRVEVSVNGGVNLPFDQTVTFGSPNAGRRLFTQTITLLNLTGNRTDTLAMNVNLASYPLPADTYAGTLRIRAQATP